MLRTALALLLLAAVTALTAGCTPGERAAVAEYCKDHADYCAELEREAHAYARGAPLPAPAAQPPAAPIALQPAAAPEALRTWAQGQAHSDDPAAVLYFGAEATYAAVAAGMQRSGGYQVAATGLTSRPGGWLLNARLLTPPPGAMVTMALTNPIGYFQLPPLTGDVRVELTTDAGRFPVTNQEFWSDNFRVLRPSQAGADSIRITGAARAFEAVFVVQVWAGGRQLLQLPVQTSEGGPAYGAFSTVLTLPGGVPVGAAVHYLTESAKDGSLTLELSLPVMPSS